MAVPFNVPEGHHNEVEVIITQLQYLLTKLQAAIRRSRGTNSQNQLSTPASTTRVRTNSSNPSRVREELSSPSPTPSPSSSPSANLPDLLNSLAWLAAASQDIIDVNIQQTTTLPIIRPTRSRTTSECCEESKISETTGNVQDWNQVGVILSKISDDCTPIIIPEETENDESSETEAEKSYLREGILSKIVPGSVSAPLWTAMICFVGWHIFRAR